MHIVAPSEKSGEEKKDPQARHQKRAAFEREREAINRLTPGGRRSSLMLWISSEGRVKGGRKRGTLY